MGCGASKRTTVAPVDEAATDGKRSKTRGSDDDLSTESIKDSPGGNRKGIAQPLAFEVPINEDSIIRKHPPKRFQRLEDQQVPLTHQLIDEKQAEAEQRRLQILTQRVQSAKRGRRHFLGSEANSPIDDEIETVKRENSTLEL